MPSSLYGKSMSLSGVELCYDSSQQGVTLDEVLLTKSESVSETVSTAPVSVVLDSSPPDGNLCQKFTGTPQLLATNSYVSMSLRVDWDAAQADQLFTIHRTTFFLEPSNTPAAPL